MRARWAGLPTLGRRVHDERPVGDGPYPDRLFEQTSKQETPELRAAPVVAEGELVEVPLEVISFNGSLVGAEQPSFDEAGHAVDPREGHVGVDARTGD